MIDTINNEHALVGAIYNLADDHGSGAAIKHVLNLDKSDFTDPFAGVLFEAIKQRVIDDQSFDPIVLADDLKASGNQNQSNLSEIGRLIRDNSSYAAIESHKSVVARASVGRKIIAASDALQEAIRNGLDPVKVVGQFESASQKALGLSFGDESEFSHITDLMSEWIKEAELINSGEKIELGLTTGFSGLDEKLGDRLLKRGTLAVIGANPGAGKTGLMLRMAERMGEQKPDEVIAIYSLEMPKMQIAERVAGMYTKNKSVKYFTDEDYGNFSEGLFRLKNTKIYVNDSTSVSVDKIKAECRQFAETGKVACIMVDYLTLLELPNKSNQTLSVGEVTKQLTRIAKELDCVVVLLCQLNRDNMKRANKRPIKSDLRDSGQIEQDAAYIIFPYRDKQFHEDSPAGDFAELNLDKNRFGPTGVAYARFIHGVWHDCDQIQGDNSCRGTQE